MSNWKDDFEEMPKGESFNEGTWAGFFVRFPNLTDFIRGSLDAESGPQIPPGSLTFWVEEGRLKCCLKCKGKGMVAFYCVENPSSIFEELEERFRSGRVEWRREGPRKRS